MWTKEVCFFADPISTTRTDDSNRTAIEEELEVLYDAYYDELESYANHQVRYASSGGTIAPPPGPGPFPGSVDAAAIAPPVQAVKKAGAIVKTTRDHKNVRPAAKKKLNNAVSKPPPVHNHTHHEGPAHGEPGHTHSPSCPHHPHNHSHTTPATTAAKAKGAAVEQETYDDEEEDEEEEEDDGEYDEDEYDEEEEDEEVGRISFPRELVLTVLDLLSNTMKMHKIYRPTTNRRKERESEATLALTFSVSERA